MQAKQNARNRSISQNADDIVFSYTHERQDTATKHIQFGIKLLENWYNKWPQSGKTIRTIFTTRQKQYTLSSAEECRINF